ncbi:MAG: efflux RND transporter permease subunit [Xenococcaceae cyanobacterium MO_207.B15]|nr:efflux RND transporter permease subunit [Xenococcaceae cyanobacterium MO_207.B15]
MILLNKRLNISRLAIKYRRITIGFWVVIAVLGLWALSSLKYSLFPEITFPVVIVRGQAPLETVLATEQKLTVPIENSLASVEGLAAINSSTYSGQTVVSLLLRTGTKIETTVKSVEDKLQKTAFASETTWEVTPFNLNESAVVSYALTSDRYTLQELQDITETKIIPQMTQLQGVARVDLKGEGESLVHFNGKKAIAFQVVKQSQANTLDVVKQVNNTVTVLTPELTAIQFNKAATQANYIQEATQATIDALLTAVAISVITIFPFLRNWRATAIAALTIPISLLGTFIVMALAGFNLETLTLLALALVIGIIVDDAIVEVENIMRHLEAGKTPHEAALIATHEIGFTASVSTLTIVAVFLPIAFMGGTLGQFFFPFGLTISAAVLTSLLVARTLSPVLAVYWLRASKKPQLDWNQQHRIVASYRKLLSWGLNHRKTVIGIAVGSFIAGIALIPLIPQGFIPQLDRGEFNILYTTALPNIVRVKQEKPETPANREKSQFSWLKKVARSPNRILARKTLSVGEELENIVLNLPEVESLYTLAGVRGQPHKGKIYVKLKPSRQSSTSEVQNKIREMLPPLAGVTVSVEDIAFVETGDDTPLKVALLGEDLALLEETATALQAEVSKIPGLVEVKTSSAPETITHFNQQRVIYLSANLTPDIALGDATQQVMAIAQSLLPSGVTLDLEGDSARIGKILGEFTLTLAFAVILMLATLYLLFRRWLEPLVIGLSLPLAIVGSMLALLFTQSDFGMISLIGLIFLLGLLDKNGVLLMDYANQLRQRGISRTQALLQTGTVRLRPIIMTTASTILGMLPIATGWGAGSELRQPMAVAIIGGLITSCLLSLIVVPVLYSVLEDWGTKKK